jgi:hypothetical protein
MSLGILFPILLCQTSRQYLLYTMTSMIALYMAHIVAYTMTSMKVFYMAHIVARVMTRMIDSHMPRLAVILLPEYQPSKSLIQ